MDKTSLIFTVSAAWVLVCLLAGSLYAFVLYFRESHFNRYLRLGLAITRGLVVGLLAFLLLAPIVRTVKNSIEKPTIVLALDNSESMTMSKDSASLKTLLNGLAKLQDNLQENGFEVGIQTLSNEKDLQKVRFSTPSSNLGGLLGAVQNDFENRNLDKVVLVSDGIHNQGTPPAFMNINFPVYTLAIGDTTAKKDIKVQTVFFNKLAYLGNEFPVVAEIANTGFSDRTLRVSLLQNGVPISSQNIQMRDITEANFTVKAQQKGVQRYTVAVENLPGEWTYQNNSRDAFVEVIDGKEKILLIANAPHPDIKAFKSILEKNENYSFEVHIIGSNKPKEPKYDLVIAYQVPDLQNAASGNLIEQYQNQGTPIFYVLGATTNTGLFSRVNQLLQLRGNARETDKVQGVFNTSFSRFGFEAEKLNLLRRLPPLEVPYGDYQTNGRADIILFQQVGNVPTTLPLLVIGTENNRKSAALTGEGLWQWRMEEFSITQKNEVVDDLILKTAQFLSAKEDTRKLRVNTTQNEYYNFEKVIFEAEAYNDVYEKISDVKVDLRIQDEKGKTYSYNFVIASTGTKFEVSGLPKGVYTYTASAQVLQKLEQATGQFVIKELQLESLNSTADFNLLSQLSQSTNGKFYTSAQLGQLEQDLMASKQANRLHSSEELLEIIHLRWFFSLIVALLTLEWVVRKYSGSY